MRSLLLLCYQLKCALRRLPELFIELIWPTRCVGCEKLGVLLCKDCQQELRYIDQGSACARCGTPFGRLVCTECTPVYEAVKLSFTQARCVLDFTELSRNIIVTYKDKGEQRLSALLAHMLAQVIPLEWKLWADVLTWIPADEEAVRRRGFDHMALIAVSLAEQSGLKTRPLLIKHSRKDQRSLGRNERKQNMRSIFSLNPEGLKVGSLQAERIILIDDVYTTGATLDAAAHTLLSAGAKEIRVVTVCRVW